jgi:protein-S-isoprenylcysteine O-methyltransferase Ste14
MSSVVLYESARRMFVLNLAFYVYAASHEERAIARTTLASAYAAYRQVTVMFLPRLVR